MCFGLGVVYNLKKNYALIKFREGLALSKEEMAVRLEVSESFYSKIELGDRNPSYNFLKKFKMEFPNAQNEKIFFSTLSH